MKTIDSTPETLEHIHRVRSLLYDVRFRLEMRGIKHDKSKLEEPEKSAFDKAISLKTVTYGSPEYKTALEALGPALQHHYANNSHHPEHFKDGIEGMSLLDLVEMLCDWKAAGERHNDGDIRRSLEVNTGRFKLTPELVSILANTIKEMGW